MATIVHNGITLAYEDRGAGKPTFVFVHGWTCNRSFFAPQIAHFARQHRVVSIVLQLAAAHPACVAAIVMVDPAPFVFAPEQRTGVEAMVAAIEAGNQEPRRQFIANHLFLPTSDRKLVEDVLAVMLATPSHVAASAMRGDLVFDGPAVAAQCKVPALHLAATPPFNPPHRMAEWLPGVVNGQTVGAGHFNQLEAPDQVNAMIEGFLRHHV
jgi:pimeloyl-ACP methyl ester carboxylesterase